MQTNGIWRPNPLINTKLCAFAGETLPAPSGPDDVADRIHGAECGSISRAGAAGIGQVVRVEWSPNALGLNQRPILTALTSHGHIVALGEDVDNSVSATSNIRSRSFKSWKILWALGVHMPIPNPGYQKGMMSSDERIVSFSWAGEIAPGRALLSYKNHVDEVVTMAVQFVSRKHEDGTINHGWDLQEMSRFVANGPHPPLSDLDPDYIPHGSSFALKWSPWCRTSNTSQTATLSYVARSHVGFRRITLSESWELDTTPSIQVEDHDTTGICLSLLPDAFVSWEDIIWNEKGVFTARGVIATPHTVKPFQINLTGPLGEAVGPHATEMCATTYPAASDTATNPIVGLIIHPPDPANKPSAPRYSLVRISATPTNQDWFQTTLPEEEAPLPQWAEDISQRISRSVPRTMALKGVDRESDDEESEDEEMGGVEVDATYVHPHRYRFWGLAASPAGGSTAVLYSRHSTQHPEKKGTSQLFFGWYVAEESGANDAPKTTTLDHLSTEGKVWEWMYGNGQQVPGTQPQSAPVLMHSPLKEQLKPILQKLRCVFCDAELQNSEMETICSKGHSFGKFENYVLHSTVANENLATCAASGLPIMQPGISRICAVCESRCLKGFELERIAGEHLGPGSIDRSVIPGLCGGCGGKFVS